MARDGRGRQAPSIPNAIILRGEFQNTAYFATELRWRQVTAEALSEMADIRVLDIHKHFGTVVALQDVSIDITSGEFVVLVGPSGCGKSTLLRVVSGLEAANDGRIHIDGRDVTDLPAKARDIAMVFQSYALYPHMNVAENMGFSLKIRGERRATIDRRVREAAETLGLTELLERKPAALSGGQRQRVAMGRAIVRDPKVFLFDEPLSNLDAQLRVAMRSEIKTLHQRLRTTVIYVTHDQVEAMTMADRIVVLRAGRIEQIGAPLELFDHPQNTFVAQFIGSPQMNLFAATVVDEGASQVAVLDIGARIKLPGTARPDPSRRIKVGIRPEHLVVSDLPDGLRLRVDVVELWARRSSSDSRPADSPSSPSSTNGSTRARAMSSDSRSGPKTSTCSTPKPESGLSRKSEGVVAMPAGTANRLAGFCAMVGRAFRTNGSRRFACHSGDGQPTRDGMTW